VKPDVVTEMGIVVQLCASSICCSTALHITPKEVDDTMLDFCGDRRKIHGIATASGTFNLLIPKQDKRQCFSEENVLLGDRCHSIGRTVVGFQ